MRTILLLALVPHAACSPPPNPIVEHERVTLLIESTGDEVPAVTGDFTAWKPQPATRMAGSDWYQYDTRLERDARVEYLLVFGGRDLRVDPRNPRRVQSVGGEASEIVMPGAEAHPELDFDLDGPRTGELIRREVDGPDGPRRVSIYRRDTDRLAPVVYFLDGTLLVDTGRVPQILDRLIALNRIRPLVAVFVDPISRADDYRANPAFREWFAGTLVPAVEETLGLTPRARGIVGVSRGAAAALDLAWHHPDLFSRCGLLIPSTSPTNLTQQIAASPAKPFRVAMVSGRYDAEWLKDAQALRDAMDSRHYELTYREVPEGHNVQTWRAHLDDVLVGLGLG